MKKLFTMLVGVLIAGSAFGQATWTDVTVNGDMESGESECYQVHEWLGDMTARTDANARIVEDPANASNHCAMVYVRSKAEAEAAGNLTTDWQGNFASWDSQFFIYATEPIPAGKEVRLKMKVKGVKSGKFETQNHSAPGTYIDGNAFGDLDYGTDWTPITTKVITVTESQANSGLQTIAFNITKSDDANTLYFDDIRLQIKDHKEDTSDWINFMRKGIYSDDIIKGTSSQGDWQCTNFTIQVPNEQGVVEKKQAPIVEVEPGVMAVRVPVRGWVLEKTPVFDKDNNPVKLTDINGEDSIDVNGEVVYDSTKVYKWTDGQLVGEKGDKKPERYACQFFVSTLHKMKTGERYRFNFSAKADHPTALGTQAHYGPSQYKDYNTFGGEDKYPITTDWTAFSLGDGQGDYPTIPGGADGCQTITFDCITLENQDNYLYFIFNECSFTEANVTLADRTLGDPEELALPVNSGDEELATPIDLAPVLNRFDFTGSLEDFIDASKAKTGSSEGIKLSALTVPEDPEDLPEETFSGKLAWTEGGFINDKGLYIADDSDKGIELKFDDSSIDGTKINISVWNNPDSGIEFGNHKSLKTKLAVSQSGWYYVYNVTLLSEADYNEWIGRLPGDANEDKAVDIEDVVLVINQILEEPVTLKFFNADVTEDGKIDVDDVVAIVNMILSATGEDNGEDAAAAPQLMKILLQNGFKF